MSATETRMSSSSQGMGQISETTTSYEAAITGSATDANVESKTAKVILSTDAGKPAFIKTIEGCSVERKCIAYDTLFESTIYQIYRIWTKYQLKIATFPEISIYQICEYFFYFKYVCTKFMTARVILRYLEKNIFNG